MGKSGKQRQQNRRPDVNSGKAKQADGIYNDGRQLGNWAKLIYILTLVVVGLLLEKCHGHKGFSYSVVWMIYGGLVGVIGTGVLYQLKVIYKADERLTELRQKTVDVWQDIGCKAGIFMEYAIKNTILIMLCLAFLWLTCVSVWGQFDVGARFRCAAESFIKYKPLLLIYDVSQPPENNPQNETVLEPANQPAAAEPVQETEATEELPEPIQQEEIILETSELEEKAQRMIFVEPVKDWSIAPEERDELLFKSGDYVIEDLTAPQAKEILAAYIGALESQKSENQFDRLADQDLKDKVARASIMDAELRTSAEKDRIISCRLEAYGTYKKEGLARLLAEDFHCYALAYKNAGGDRKIIVSYYLQSLKWLYERLKYDGLSQKTQKEILRSISYRYNDIMTYSEPETEQWNRAKVLAELFKEMA